CQGGPRGDLRQWTYAAGQISRDDVANNRWCWNIGRAHKSNHVYLVTDLSRGEVCQRCHDQV
ncbi:unnamed protein product, partial [Laminaria digitata]